MAIFLNILKWGEERWISGGNAIIKDHPLDPIVKSGFLLFCIYYVNQEFQEKN